jgi:hypothetical protein
MRTVNPAAAQAAHDAWTRASRRALFSRLQHFLNPDRNKLLSLNDVKEILKPRHEVYRGIKAVPVRLIVGSEGRYHDFNKRFEPRTDWMRQRWERVAQASIDEVPLPPVQLYELGGVYFVRDGNHRVSVARARGVEEIDAEVTFLGSEIKIRPEDTIDGLRAALILYEKKIFYAETFFGDLTGDWDLDFSRTGRYDVIYNHILVHKYYINETREAEIPFSDALVSWYNKVYTPIMRIIEEEKICARFPERKPGDLYVWIIKRGDELKKRYGSEAGARDAAPPTPRA